MEPIQFINSRNEEAYGIKIKVKHSLYPQNQIVKWIGYTQDNDTFYFEHFDGDGQSEEYVKHFIEEFHKILKSHQLPEECAGDLLFLTKEMWHSDSYSSYIYHKRRLAERANIIIQLLETVPYHLDDTITYDKLVELVSYYDKHALEEFEMGEQFNKDNYTPAEFKVIKQGMWREMSVKITLENNKTLYLDRYACLKLIKLNLPLDNRSLSIYKMKAIQTVLTDVLSYLKSNNTNFYIKLLELDLDNIYPKDIKELKKINLVPISKSWNHSTKMLVKEMAQYLNDYNYIRYSSTSKDKEPRLSKEQKYFIFDVLVLLGLRTYDNKELQPDESWNNYLERKSYFKQKIEAAALNFKAEDYVLNNLKGLFRTKKTKR